MRGRRSRVAAAAATLMLALCALRSAPVPAADEAPAHVHPLATLADWAAGAQLFAGLGHFHRAVTTGSAPAQEYFDQGMRLMYAFNHDEAARSFAQAAQLDPSCAACYWGFALAVGPNYNFLEMDAAKAAVGWQALQLAEHNAAHASAVEQALIGALAARYAGPDPLDEARVSRVLEDYAKAMRAVAARYPDDADVQTLCAESEMSVHAWKLWTPEGHPAEGTLDAEARLEAVLKRDPDHPGANHFYVHVMEESPHPERALVAAERLRGMMPAAGHLEHMPAHIMQRVGRYEDAALANRHGIAADRAYLAGVTPPGHYAMYLGHNYAFLAYAAAMEGRKAESLAAVQGLLETDPVAQMVQMGDSAWGLTPAYTVLMRFGLWDELLALGPPDPRARGMRAGYLFGRGVALAARGRTDDARATLAELRSLDASLGEHEHFLHQMLGIAIPVVAARIAATDGKNEEAVELLRQAAALEDQVPYEEPADWFFPVRHLLGAQLLIAGNPQQAERVYREDLKRNPANGWALYGLEQSLRAEHNTGEARRAGAAFERAWRYADVRLPASAFWFAGADSTSCECQRDNSPPRALTAPAGGS
jgi:tetratricopeptide (TPR) repeat protein